MLCSSGRLRFWWGSADLCLGIVFYGLKCECFWAASTVGGWLIHSWLVVVGTVGTGADEVPIKVWCTVVEACASTSQSNSIV